MCGAARFPRSGVAHTASGPDRQSSRASAHPHERQGLVCRLLAGRAALGAAQIAAHRDYLLRIALAGLATTEEGAMVVRPEPALGETRVHGFGGHRPHGARPPPLQLRPHSRQMISVSNTAAWPYALGSSVTTALTFWSRPEQYTVIFAPCDSVLCGTPELRGVDWATSGCRRCTREADCSPSPRAAGARSPRRRWRSFRTPRYRPLPAGGEYDAPT